MVGPWVVGTACGPFRVVRVGSWARPCGATDSLLLLEYVRTGRDEYGEELDLDSVFSVLYEYEYCSSARRGLSGVSVTT